MKRKMYPNCCAALCLYDLGFSHATGHERWRERITGEQRTVTKDEVVEAVTAGYNQGVRMFTAITASRYKNDEQHKVTKLLKRLGFRHSKPVKSKYSTDLVLLYLTIGDTNELKAFKTNSQSVKG